MSKLFSTIVSATLLFHTHLILPCCEVVNSPIATITSVTEPHGVAFSPNGSCLSVADSENIKIYNSSTLNCSGLNGANPVAVIDNGTTSSGRSWSSSFSPDGTCLVASNNNSDPDQPAFKIYQTNDGTCAGFNGATPALTITPNFNRPLPSIYSLDGNCLLLASGTFNEAQVSQRIALGCAGFDTNLINITFTDNTRQFALNSTGTCLARASRDEGIFFHSTSGGCPPYTEVASIPIPADVSGVFGVTFISDSCIVASLQRGFNPNATTDINIYRSTDGTCSGFNNATPTTVFTIPDAVYELAASPDKTCLAIAKSGITSGQNSAVVIYPILSSIIITPGPLALCLASTVLLQGLAQPGATYQWQRNGFNILFATSTSYNANQAGSYTLVTTINGCSVTSDPIVITQLSATVTPSGPTTFCAGQSVVLTTNEYDNATYQWRLNGSDIPGATSFSYTATTSGSYTVFINVSAVPPCDITSSPIAVTVNPLPTATITPAGPTIFCAGDSVTLNANTGAGLTYQWQLNGGNIGGATNASYVATASGSYTVVVTDANTCSNTSTPVVVTVNPLPTATITPAGPTTFCAGDSVTLNANTGVGLTYQWQLGGSNILGATNASYAATASGSYTVVVTDANTCTNTSAPTIVTVNPLPTATNTPAGPTTFCAGDSVTLNANIGANLTYQWQNNGSNIPGATGNAYVATASGSYTVVVTSTVTTCSATSNAIVVTVNPLPAANITPAGPVDICAGQSIQLNANTGAGLTYQWQNNNIDIPSETNASLIVSAAGSYTVVVTANGCSTTSAPTLVNVNPLPAAIITPVGPTTFCAGDSVTLNANIGANLTYQWQNNGVNIPTATNDSYVAATAGSYTVVVTSTITGCQATSAPVVVTINPLPDAIITPNRSPNLCTGDSVTLNANIGAGLTYQWQLNGANIPGETSSSYITGTAGSYTVVVTVLATGCTATSAPITVTVNPLPAAVITPAGPITICQGETALLQANTGSGLSYQWQLNGIDIPGATASSYPATNGGLYTVLVTTSAGCSTLSNIVELFVNPLPVATITATPNRIAPSDSATLVATPTVGTAPFQIIWNDGVVQDNVIISAERTVQPATTTTYSFEVIDANGCASDPGDTITVFVCNKPYPISVIANAIFDKCCGNC